MFGCIAYPHVPDELRKKLNNKAEKCIFIGYSLDTKGYKLYNPKTQKVIISPDVTFDEDGIWDWSEEEKRSLPTPIFINNEVDTSNREPSSSSTSEESPHEVEETSPTEPEESSSPILRR